MNEQSRILVDNPYIKNTLIEYPSKTLKNKVLGIPNFQKFEEDKPTTKI